MIVSAGPRTLGALSCTCSFPVFVLCTVESFTLFKRECNEFCLVFECLIVSFTRPVFLVFVSGSFRTDAPSIVPPHLCFHLVWLHWSLFIPDACVDCHHFVLLHLKTCFKVTPTALGLSSQAHPVALNILSGITSYRKGKPICTHMFLAVWQVLV